MSDLTAGSSPKAWISLIAAVCIQTCLGSVYAWSVFVPSIVETYRLTVAQCQFVFGSTIATFTVAMVLAGRIIKFSSARWIAATGIVLYAGGWGLASVFADRFVFLLISISVIGGCGIGCGYVAALTCSIRWFPNNKGLVTGLTVAGFGSGGALLAAPLADLLAQHSPAQVFRLLALFYGLVAGTGALLLFKAPQTASGLPAFQMPGLKTLLNDRAFRLLAFGMFCGTFPGLMIIGNLQSIGLEGGLSNAAAAVSLFAIGNAAGRIGWGWLSDRLGDRTIPWSLALLCSGIALLIPARSDPRLFAFVAFICGTGFGACFVLYAAQTASWFGIDAVETIYPVLFLIYGFAGLTGPAIGGYLFDLSGGYGPAILISTLIAAAGFLITIRGGSTLSTEP